jgi:energy-converting hydrogenase B subunit D
VLVGFTLLLLGLAVAVLVQERLLNAVILLGVFSLVSSAVYFLVGAPDLAVTEGAIGVAFVTFIYVLALSDQGKLHVIAEEVPPFLYQEKGKLRGAELEILREFAEDSNLDLEVEFVTPEELASKLGGRRADLVAGAYFSGYLSGEELRDTVSFNEARLTRVDLSGEEGNKVGVLPETSFVENQLESSRDAEGSRDVKKGDLVQFESLDELVEAYNEGEISGFFADSGRVSNALYRINTPLRERSETVSAGEIGYCFAVSSDDEELLDRLNDYLKNLKRKGDVDELLERYFR